MTAERKAELRDHPLWVEPSEVCELLDALDAAEAEIACWREDRCMVTKHLWGTDTRSEGHPCECPVCCRHEAIISDVSRECAEIADAQKQEWIRPSEGARPLPECAHACHLVAMKIRERFGLEEK